MLALCCSCRSLPALAAPQPSHSPLISASRAPPLHSAYSLVNRTKDFTVFVDDIACRADDQGGTRLQDGSVVDVAGLHLVLEMR